MHGDEPLSTYKYEIKTKALSKYSQAGTITRGPELKQLNLMVFSSRLRECIYLSLHVHRATGTSRKQTCSSLRCFILKQEQLV